MDLIGFEVEAQTPTSADLDHPAGRWFVEVLGVVPRVTAYVHDVDAVVSELAARGVATSPIDVDSDVEGARGVRASGPAGLTVDVVQPAPEGHYDQRITEFIESAADLEGPATGELASSLLAVVASAWEAIDGLLVGVAHNKVLATQLLLSQQSRSEELDSPTYWQRSAASTLLSGFVGRGAPTVS